SALVFVVVAAVLIPWHWLPGQHVHAVPARSVFTAAQIAHDQHVAWLFRLPAWGNLALSMLVALVLGLTRWGGRFVSLLPGRWWVQVLLGTGVLTLLGVLVQLPLNIRSQHVELTTGLSTEAWGSWVSDQATSFGVDWVFTAVPVLGLMVLARKAPRTWPAWAAAGAVVLAMVGSFVYPVAVEPLFNNFTPLAAGPVRTEIFALAKAEHVHISDVLVADASRRTTTLNAYVSGFGSTRRVVIYDTVLKSLTKPEIASIVAHELGHAKHNDVLVGTILGAVGGGFGIGLLGLLFNSGWLLRRAGTSSAGDPRSVALLLALVAVGSFLVSPIENTMSRAVEARADLASLRTTNDPATFIEMQRLLSLRALAAPSPPAISQFWFGSHPTVLQRIGMARQFDR
ncbi:MAG TPA: M48 family metalloprotease, partial [Marmoricola sp.]|nr:M48 family metalloprotease [Marmoricola sp.]